MKISELMSVLIEKQQELGDLEFEVHMPVIGGVENIDGVDFSSKRLLVDPNFFNLTLN